MKFIILSFCLVMSPGIFAKESKKPASSKAGAEREMRSNIKDTLLAKFSQNYKNNKELEKVKNEALAHKGDAVPALIEIMKNGKYPEKNRWVATFLLGKIMGKKASPFIARFLKHPSWVMRMASLKTLLALKERQYASAFVDALKDQSFIVRTQALENIRQLKIKQVGAHVWAMLYDKRNYYDNKSGKKRTNIIKNVITTVGDLKFDDAKEPLLKMIQKKKYNDIFPEIEYTLKKLTGKEPPEGKQHIKRLYWEKVAVASKTI